MGIDVLHGVMRPGISGRLGGTAQEDSLCLPHSAHSSSAMQSAGGGLLKLLFP